MGCFTSFITFAQVIERSVFGELLGEIPKECVECVKLDAVNFTEAEAKLFNEINLKHTSGCFGKEIFSGRDKMVQRDEFEKFVTYLLFCRCRFLANLINVICLLFCRFYQTSSFPLNLTNCFSGKRL